MTPLRPAIAELSFVVAGEPLAVVPLAERRVDWPGGGFRLAITADGHTLHWQNRDITIAEAITARPLAAPLLMLPVRGERRGRLTISDAIHYQIGLQVEVLDADVYAQVHDELVVDGLRRGLLHRFEPHQRIALTPLALVIVEQVPGGLSVSAFHTFPEELSIVKTQSLIEPPQRG